MLHQNITPFGVHYKKICNHLCETATNSAKIHSVARKYKHLCINQIQLRFLRFYQHSITLLVIQMCHSAYKRDRKIYFHSGGGGTPIHYLYGYVPPNGVVILKLLIQKGVSISEPFSRTGYKKFIFCLKLLLIIKTHLFDV